MTTTKPAPVQGPQIDLPDDPAMALEPARTVGSIFADKTMIRPLVAAIVAMIAVTTGWIAETAVIDNLTTIVTTVAVIYAAWSAQAEASRRAREQAEATRAVVYAPQTAAEIAREAAAAQRVNWSDPSTWPSTPQGASDYNRRGGDA